MQTAKYYKDYRQTLPDSYIKDVLKKQEILITPESIAAKRKQIIDYRKKQADKALTPKITTTNEALAVQDTINHNITFTDHAMYRAKTRLGLESSSDVLKHVSLVFESGLCIHNLGAKASGWANKKTYADKHNNGVNDVRIYNGYIYLFCDKKLITVYAIPDDIKTYIDNYKGSNYRNPDKKSKEEIKKFRNEARLKINAVVKELEEKTKLTVGDIYSDHYPGTHWHINTVIKFNELDIDKK